MTVVLDPALEGLDDEYAQANLLTPVGLRRTCLLLDAVKDVHPVHLAVYCQKDPLARVPILSNWYEAPGYKAGEE